MPDSAGSTELDHRGAYAQPRAINDMQPTTRFHPSELPADPEAIRRFPKHLIDVNHTTESPGSDSDPESRLRRGAETFMENAHRFGGLQKMRDFMGELFGVNTSPPADEPVAEVVPASTEEEPVAEVVPASTEEEPVIDAPVGDATTPQ